MRIWAAYFLMLTLLPGGVYAQAPETDSGLPPWALNENGEAPRIAEAEPEARYVPRIWANIEYLLWWAKNDSTPILATTGPSSEKRPGVLGGTYTKHLLGGDLDHNENHGGRFTVGMPVGAAGAAVEVNYFFLTFRDVNPSISSPGTPVLSRPFFDVLTQQQDVSLIAYPELVRGSFQVRNSTFLQGGEGLYWLPVLEGTYGKIEAGVGLRYLNLDDELELLETSIGGRKAGLFLNKTISILDRFDTQNDFVGGQLGLRAETHYKRLHFQAAAKVALGDVYQQAEVAGSTAVQPDNTVAAAGFYALSSNIGSYERHRFGVVPEVQGKVALEVSRHFRLFAAYSAMFWNDVVRPGALVNPNINPALLPLSNRFGAGGPAQPSFSFNGTDFWAHGVNFGMEFKY